MKPTQQKIPLLDVFRFLCSVLVILVHYEGFFGTHLIQGAYATSAVSWFFMLSGFVLAYNYPQLQGYGALRGFYLHRLIRIYPVYCLAVLFASAVVIIIYYWGPENYFNTTLRPAYLSYDIAQTKDFSFWSIAVLRHLSFTQSLAAPESLKLFINGPLWSLVLEMYFYVFFPLFLLLIKKINTGMRIVITLLSGYLLQFLLIQILLPEAEVYGMREIQESIYTNPLVRVIEFLFGMILFKAWLLLSQVKKRHFSLKWLFIAAMALLTYVALIEFGERYLPYQYNRFFVTVPIITVLVYAIVRINWYPGEKMTRFCSTLGALSYLIYCLHWPLMDLLLYSQVFQPNSHPLLTLTLVFGLLLFLSYAIYRVAESPLRKYLLVRVSH